MAASSKPSTAQAILTAGLLVGTLDIAAASIQRLQAGGKLTRLCQYIASGAFGKEAFNGGTPMVVAGLLFHYVIAFSFTVFFFLLYPRIPLLAKHRVLTGLVYGVFTWAITTRIVVPLSAIGPRPFNLSASVIAASILVVCIGLPLSFLAHRHYGGKK
jgi:hypothetical protein